MKKIIIILLFSVSICPIIGQNDSSSKHGKTPIVKPDTAAFTEVKAYKMLYENQKEANDHILNTIYYALSGLALAVIVVIGGTWVFNIKRVEDLRAGISDQITRADNETSKNLIEKINSLSADKTSEINKMQIKLQEDVTANITKLTAQFNEFAIKIRDDTKADNNQLTQNFQQNLEAFTNTYNQQINSIQTSFEERISTLNLRLTKEEEGMTTQVKLVNELNSTMNKIKTDSISQLYRLNGAYWELAGVLSNSLMYYIMEGERVSGNNENMFMPLHSIWQILKKLKKISANDKDRINALIKKADPEKDKSWIERIVQLLEKLPITEST